MLAHWNCNNVLDILRRLLWAIEVAEKEARELVEEGGDANKVKELFGYRAQWSRYVGDRMPGLGRAIKDGKVTGYMLDRLEMDLTALHYEKGAESIDFRDKVTLIELMGKKLHALEPKHAGRATRIKKDNVRKWRQLIRAYLRGHPHKVPWAVDQSESQRIVHHQHLLERYATSQEMKEEDWWMEQGDPKRQRT